MGMPTDNAKVQVINEPRTRGAAGTITITLSPIDVVNLWLATPLPNEDDNPRTSA